MKIRDRSYLLRQNEALFEATLDEFSQKPFALASTNTIIKQADYNKGSFYYRFKAKEDIYFALIDYVYTISISLYRAKPLYQSLHKNPQAIVRAAFENIRQLWLMDPRYIELLRRIQAEEAGFQAIIADACVDAQIQRFDHLLQDALASHDKDQSQLVLKVYKHLLLHYFSDFNRDDFNQKVALISQYLFSGLTPIKTQGA